MAWCRKKTGKELASSQQAALRQALSARVLIITGGSQGYIKLLRSVRQGWVPISFSETNSRASAPPFVAKVERQNFRRHSHPFSLSLAFAPQFTVNLNRIHEMRSSASQFQLSRTPLADLGVPWGHHGTTMDLPWYHSSIAGASFLSH